MEKKVTVLAAVLSLCCLLSNPGRGRTEESVPTITVGHVGHDHQLALYAAAEAGPSLQTGYGVHLKELKPQEVYDLYDGGVFAARVHMVRVGGGSKMPAAMEQGQIEVGLGGLGPVMKFVDKGALIKIVAPLNNDGDALVLRNEISAASWADFVQHLKQSERPIRIGYKDPMANAYLIFISALAEEGIRFGQEPVSADGRPVQVMMVNLQGDENTLPSMEAGLVDGVVANEPMPSILVHKKSGRRIVDLSSLPPSGKWKDHPCCVVAATDAALRDKRAIITSLLKAIVAGTDIIQHDRQQALAAQAAWTRTAPEIGRQSIRNVTYVARADEAWLSAVDVWIGLMQSSHGFQKILKSKSAGDIRAALFDLKPLEEALSGRELRSGKGKRD